MNSSLPQIGGRLAKFWENWQQVSSDPWVLETVKEGYKIHLISPPSNSNKVSFISRRFSKIRHFEASCSGNGTKRSNRTSSSRRRLLQSTICCAKSKWGLETSNRSIRSEQMGSLPIISDGDTKNHSKFSSKGTLDDLHRPPRRLLSCDDSQKVQAHVEVFPRQPNMAVQGSAFWPVYIPQGFYKDPKTSVGTCPQEVDTSTYVSGRLAVNSGNAGSCNDTNKLRSVNVSKIRVDSQPGKVRIDPLAAIGVPGNANRHQSRDSYAFKEENHKVGVSLHRLFVQSSTSSLQVAPNSGPFSIIRETGPVRSRKSSTHSMATQTFLETEHRQPIDEDSSECGMLFSPNVVESDGQPDQGHFHGDSRNRLLSFHGFEQHWLGSSRRRSYCCRHMADVHETSAHQCPRIECCLARPEVPVTPYSGFQCCANVRQYGHHSISPKSGGNKISRNVRSSYPCMQVDGNSCDKLNPQAYMWNFKCSSGRTQSQRSNSQDRMESQSGDIQPDLQNLGQPTCGLVCHQSEHQASDIYLANTRTRGMEGGCSSSVLEKLVCVCIPTNQPDKSLSEQNQIRQTRGAASGTQLGESGVVSGPYRIVNRSSNSVATPQTSTAANVLGVFSPQSSKSGPTRVEVISRRAQERGFSKAVSSRISIPNRPVTSKVYEGHWRSFSDWCKLEEINPSCPSIPQIADFLVYLFEMKGLSVSTIKGYKSTLSSVMAASGIDHLYLS